MLNIFLKNEVVIRTNSAAITLSVDDRSTGKIYHYGEAGILDIIQCHTGSLYENGKVGYVDLAKGRIVLTENSDVEAINIVAATDDSGNKLNCYNNPIIADGGVKEENMPAIVSRDQVTVSGKTELVQIQKIDAKGNVQGTAEQVYVYENGSVGTTEKTSTQNTTVSSTLGVKVLDATNNAGEKAYSETEQDTKKDEVAGEAVNAEVAAKTNDDGSQKYVARIGGKGYETLQAALDASNVNETIYLLFDVTETVTINKNLTLDGKGHKITGSTASNPKCIQFVGGNTVEEISVTIKNVELSASSSGYPFYVQRPTDLTIEGCETYGYCAIYFKPGCAGTVVNADSTFFNAPADKASAGGWNNFGMFAIKEDNIQLNLNNCTMDATGNGTAEFAVFIASSTETSDINIGTTVNVSGDETVLKGNMVWNNGYGDSYNDTQMKINLYGGMYELTDYIIGYNTTPVTLYGGTFDVEPDYYISIDPDSELTQVSGKNEWTVSKRSVIAQATIGTTVTDICSVTSLFNFIKNCNETATIVLKDNINSGSTQFYMDNTVDITIDLNGFTVTGSKNGSMFYTDCGTFTFTDSVGTGTVVNNGAYGSSKGVACGYTYDSSTSSYVYGHINILGGTYTAVYPVYSDYKGYATISGGTIVGTLSGSGSYTINGGKFSEDPSNILNEKVGKLVGDYYEVFEAQEDDYVAKIGDTKYLTIQKAYNSASSGDTIILLKDAVLTDWNSKQITYSGIGKTLTLSYAYTEITYNCNVVTTLSISQGTFNGTVIAGSISGGTFNGSVTCTNTISNGTFNSTVTCSGEITEGTFNNTVTCSTIKGGLFANDPTANVAEGYATSTNGTKYLVFAASNVNSTKLVAGTSSHELIGFTASGYEAIANSSSTSWFVAPSANCSEGKIMTGIYNDSPYYYLASGFSSIRVKDSTDAWKYVVGQNVQSYNNKLSEGMFKFDPTEYVDTTTFAVTNPSQGVFNVALISGKGLVKIGDAEYLTVSSALSAASDSVETTIILQNNLTENVTISSGKVIILDLNGYTLTSSLTVYGNLTIKDSSNGKTGSLVSSGTAITCKSSTCNLTIESGAITAATYGIYVSTSKPTIALNGGTISGNTYGFYAYYGCTTTIDGATVSSIRLWDSGASMSIKSGSITGTVKVDIGTLTITGGTFASNPGDKYISAGYHWDSTNNTVVADN